MSNLESSLRVELFYKEYCPFCKMVVKYINHQELNVELRETSLVSEYNEELVKEGGKKQVPCLKIIQAGNKTKWLYESMDIITYLKKHAAKLKLVE
ncbi:glutathione S-transferase N-terminal domain-containing protein [Pseudoalteromonas sp. SWXJZ94C]|uniref:glutaredoxin family protein n=1 Tax=unclassified Pseudoalteromonas TaxID=194690 RepID=UPI000406A166|nr:MULTISPECIES: glutaredoxin domain-containing protein [unclassified Pseudoalteromonas]MBH0056565.1 glutathione S-transferase N-terminal domain-containing protein [Pseudoalteromonas sp. SWXJZ94C]